MKQRIKELEHDILKLETEKKLLQERLKFLGETYRSEVIVRDANKPCPGMEVGTTVLGNFIHGKVTWVGNGGGVWRGQELCRVDGHDGLIPTNRLIACVD